MPGMTVLACAFSTLKIDCFLLWIAAIVIARSVDVNGQETGNGTMLAPARHRHGLDEGAFRLTRKDGSPGIDGGESAGGQPVGLSTSRVAGLLGVLRCGAASDDEAGCGHRTELCPAGFRLSSPDNALGSIEHAFFAVRWSLDSRHESRRSYWKCRRSGVAAGWKRVRWFVCSRPCDCKSYRKASSSGRSTMIGPNLWGVRLRRVASRR